jgi:hypothetical protein
MAAFPSALIECIRDARLPGDSEIALLAAKIWSEGMCFLPGSTPQAAIKLALQAFSPGVL